MISFNLHNQLGKYSLPYFTDEETETEKSVICLKLDTKQEGSRLNRFLSSPRKKFGLQMSSRYERSGKVVSSPSVEDCECPGEGIRRPDTASFSADAECRAQVFCETQNYSRRAAFPPSNLEDDRGRWGAAGTSPSSPSAPPPPPRDTSQTTGDEWTFSQSLWASGPDLDL